MTYYTKGKNDKNNGWHLIMSEYKILTFLGVDGKKKPCKPRILYWAKISFKGAYKINALKKNEENAFCQLTCTVRHAKTSSLGLGKDITQKLKFSERKE